MKRFHVHVGVEDLEAGIRFYSRLFGADPTLRKADYAKWMVDEPALNFAISTSDGHRGVSHLGLEGDSADELADIQRRFKAADDAIRDEPNAACCHARSDKHWATDPQGIQWEGFHTRGLLEDEIAPTTTAAAPSECCAPSTTEQPPASEAPRGAARCCA